MRSSAASAIATKTLAAAQESLDSGNPHVAGFAIPDVSRHACTPRRPREAHRPQHRRLSAGDGRRTRRRRSRGWRSARTTIISAAASTATRSPPRTTWARSTSGADDNASGTAAVLAIGERLAGQPRRRNVLLQFWSGEELGLLGSAAFVNAPAGAPRSARRLPELRHGRPDAGQQADGAGHRHEPGLGALHRAGEHRRRLRPAAAARIPYQPTDVASFNQAGVPMPELLHRHARRLPQAVRHGRQDQLRRSRSRSSSSRAAIATRVIDADDGAGVHEGRAAERRRRTRRRARLHRHDSRLLHRGRRACCSAASSAAVRPKQAGLQKGDVIVEIAGQTIANIYDYTYALEVLKIGEPAKVVYMRSGERRETTLTPAARK